MIIADLLLASAARHKYQRRLLLSCMKMREATRRGCSYAARAMRRGILMISRCIDAAALTVMLHFTRAHDALPRKRCYASRQCHFICYFTIELHGAPTRLLAPAPSAAHAEMMPARGHANTLPASRRRYQFLSAVGESRSCRSSISPIHHRKWSFEIILPPS